MTWSLFESRFINFRELIVELWQNLSNMAVLIRISDRYCISLKLLAVSSICTLAIKGFQALPCQLNFTLTEQQPVKN